IRFGQGTPNSHGDYIDLNIGLNGLLYALFPGGSPAGNMLDIFDPKSMTLLRTLNLNMDLGAIAVDHSGNIFATSPFDARIFRFDANGVLTGSLVTGTNGLRDLDLSSDGRLLTVSSTGNVILADTSLTSTTSFNVGSSNTFFAAFVGSPVPEPAVSVLLIAGGGLALVMRKW
ncbi:MAG TPA: PEP-CTERM sorting domain-containing protein, partial [Chthoniobacterales bacterium]